MNHSKYYTLPLLAGVGFILAAVSGLVAASEPYEKQRSRLVEEIRDDVRQSSLYLNKTALNPKVMKALGKVPRHEFIPRAYRNEAYYNRPVPIGYGQTISQPYIVAIMTDLLKPQAHYRALEVGTGSGYQAAILAELVEQVYSIEIIRPLSERARKALKRTGYENIKVRFGDGYYGWEEHAPYDIIIVTAAAGHIPPPLLKQLKPGGRMVIPVGSRFQTQHLVLVMKDEKGTLKTREILPVIFVPFTGGH